MVKDHKRKICLLIDMTVLTGNNILNKENKMRIHKDVEIENENMWHLKTTNVPVIVRALGMIKTEADKYISKIPGSSSLYEIYKKIAFCWTVHLLGRREYI